MSIEIRCDGQKCRNRDFDICYCQDCYITLQTQLEKALERISELENSEG